METTKKVNETKVKKETSKKVDFASLSLLTNDIPTSENTGTGRKEIYKGLNGLTSKEQKDKRRNFRKFREQYVNDFITAAKAKNEEKIISTFVKWQKFYKENYVNNDFTLSSVTSDIRNEADKKRLEAFLKGMKQIAEQSETK